MALSELDHTVGQAILRPSWVEVDLDHIAHNHQQVRRIIPGVKLLAVVKADAYGLGAVPVATLLQDLGVDCLGVVMLDEAIQLRRAGITIPILNMGEILPHQADLVLQHDLEQIVFQPEMVAALSAAALAHDKIAQVHLKVDTGMSRYGVRCDDVPEALNAFQGRPGVQFKGVMTHFPMSDELDKSFALLQIRRFRALRAGLEQAGHRIPIWHMCNSGGVLDLADAHMDMVRVGLLLYGYYPSLQVRRPLNLRPAMSVKTRIIALRTVHRGDSVGYGRRFIAAQDERIAVLPIGYADGYDRKLRGVGQVLIGGEKAPLVSGLCMDACFVKVTHLPQVQTGNVVTLMGQDGPWEISPHDIADAIGSVSYEVMARFGKRLPRVYIKGRRLHAAHNQLAPATN